MVSREQSLELLRNFAHNYGLLRQFVCELAGKYRERYDELQANQSQHYHINVIEELHINENGHSRVLCKLLQYKNPDGKYVFLESLLREIGITKNAFSEIKITAPIITQEKKRIDLWVRDKASGYAIIFENKIYNAADQDAQIYRYIQETEKDGFSKESIFIVYMPEYKKDPEKRSWGDGKKEYEKKFAERYVCFPFKEEISKWVKDTLESKIVEWENEIILHSALLQYSHFLDTLYNKQESNMLQSLESVIKNSLSPDFDKKSEEDQIKILSDCISALESLASENDETLAEKTDKNKAVLESLLSRLNALLDRYILTLCKTKRDDIIKNQHPDLNLQIIEDGYITLVLPPFQGLSNELTLSIKPERSNTYIQLTSKSGKLKETSAFDNLLESKTFTNNNQWNYWKLVDFSPSNIKAVIDGYKTILDRILDTKYWEV